MICACLLRVICLWQRVIEDINEVLGGILYLTISNCVVVITLSSYIIVLVSRRGNLKPTEISPVYNRIFPQKVPVKIVSTYVVVIAAFLIETLVFCLVGQGIIREVKARIFIRLDYLLFIIAHQILTPQKIGACL
jgi:hypothetical protein